MVAQNFLSFGKSWSKSKFGQRAACLLECEVVLDDSQVSRGTGGDGKIPEKYIIVGNDCLVRVKRVLMFSERNTPQKDLRWIGSIVVILISLILLAMILFKANKKTLTQKLVYHRDAQHEKISK